MCWVALDRASALAEIRGDPKLAATWLPWSGSRQTRVDAVLDSILLHTRRNQRLPRRLWPIVESQA
jgi:hypothetical protein